MRHKKIIISAAAALVVVVAAIAVLATTGNNPVHRAIAQPDGGKSELQPKTPIKLGNYRYVSPCQTLPPANVDHIYGTLGDKASYLQTYYDSSLSASYLAAHSGLLGLETSCAYDFGDDNQTTLTLSLNNFPTAAAAQAQLAEYVHLGSPAATSELESLTGPTAFVQALKQLAASNIADLGAVQLPGLNSAVYFQAGHGTFLTVRGNSLLQLTYATGGSSLFDTSRVTGANDANALRDKINQSYAAIFKNYDNKKLSQAPLSSQFGSEAHYTGGAPYIEPCLVLSSAVFQQVTGHSQTEAVQSASLERNTVARRARNQDVFYKSPNSSCSRQADVGDASAGNAQTYQVETSIRYAPSAAQAKQLLGDYILFTIKNGNTEDTSAIKDVSQLVQAQAVRSLSGTAADHVYLFDTAKYATGNSRISMLYFASGPYLVQVSVNDNTDPLNPDAAKIVPTDAQYKAIVNAMVPNIKRISR